LSQQTSNAEVPHRQINFDAVAGENSEPVGDGEATLEETAAREREYLRNRLRGELKRDPTDAELDEWLREHTEGY